MCKTVVFKKLCTKKCEFIMFLYQGLQMFIHMLKTVCAKLLTACELVNKSWKNAI